jgi:hypothetical protein
MYARLVTVQVEPARVGELVSAVECTEIPATRRQPGFKARLLLHDAASGRIVLLTLWESRVALRDGEMRGALREELGVLALATSSLDTPLTLHRAAYQVVGSDLAALGASSAERPGAPRPAAVAGLFGGEGGPVHRFDPGQ